MQAFRAEVSTGAAEQRTVQLADGDKVQLAARSAIAIEGGGRRVRLLRGQAFFEVRHNPEHPFVVVAHAITLRDLGTAFEVSLDEASAKVAVDHGDVEVAYEGETSAATVRAGPGRWVRVTEKGLISQGSESRSQIAAWRRRQLIASNRPVWAVVDDLRPYFSGLIVLGDGGFAQRRMTGVYDLGDPVCALQALAKAQPGVSVHRISPWLLVMAGP